MMVNAVARFAGSLFFTNRSWGLRPRLYAVARSASFTCACFAGYFLGVFTVITFENAELPDALNALTRNR
jgi:hypothetical protein